MAENPPLDGLRPPAPIPRRRPAVRRRRAGSTRSASPPAAARTATPAWRGSTGSGRRTPERARGASRPPACRPRAVGGARPRLPGAPTLARQGQAEPAGRRRADAERADRRVNWRAFAESAPQLAAFGEERSRATGIVLLGTLRRDGWPRISPDEACAVGDERLLGMMWRSRKALDPRRDPRLTVVTPRPDRIAAPGDLKLYGFAVETADPAVRAAHADVVEAAV